jgi:hypothetical protein
MGVDKNERSNRGGARGITGDFISIGKELGGKEAELASRRGPAPQRLGIASAVGLSYPTRHSASK